MANDKSGRSKRVNPLATIIGIVILVVASFFGIEFSEEILTVTTVEQKGTQPIQDIEGQLVVHIIDQTTPNMIQGLKGIFARKPLISRGI